MKNIKIKKEFNNYLENKIFSDLENELKGKIEEKITSEKATGDLEAEIEEINIIDTNDTDNIYCEVKASIEGGDEFVGKFNLKIKFDLYVSFKEKDDDLKFNRDQIEEFNEDVNLVSIVDF